MQQTHDTNLEGDRTTLGGAGARLMVVFGLVGVVALALAFVLGSRRGDDLQYVFHAYLVSYCFWLSLSLGGLFFVAVQHATRAGWSVAVRRIAEVFAANWLMLVILFLPIALAGMDRLYPWTDAKTVADSHLLQGKQAYLNLPFFFARCAVYFVVWIGTAWFFLRSSRQQDATRDPALTIGMERFSPVALLLFAVTVTFAAFDWLMSLTPAWFSTIFGLYFFSGAVVGFLAMLIVVAFALQQSGRLTRSLNSEHYHELGKLLLGFIVFWGYMAFSQYMLIWYANIPEETVWYLPRQQGPWATVSLVLLFGHLLIPFVGLLSREVKRRRAVLLTWAVWMLVAHWIDLYYLVMPALGAEQLPLGAIDVCCLLGIGGLYLAGWMQLADRQALLPIGDPRLGESLAFENL